MHLEGPSGDVHPMICYLRNLQDARRTDLVLVRGNILEFGFLLLSLFAMFGPSRIS